MAGEDDIQPLEEATPTPRLAPPTVPGPVGPRPGLSRWPVVVAVIAFVYAGLGVFVALYGLFTPVMAVFMSYTMPGGDPEAVSRLQFWAWVRGGVALAEFLLLAWLVWGGVELTRRRPRAARLLQSWSWAMIVLALLGVATSCLMQIAQVDVMIAQMSATTPGMTTTPAMIPTMRTTMYATYITMAVVMGLGWRWPLPIFFLAIWFRRRKVKEEVATWEGPPVASGGFLTPAP